GPDGELTMAAAHETVVRRLAATWPVGPRLDELIHRARSFRRNVKKDGTSALGYIPGKGSSTLPVSTPERNPNLARVYVAALYDFLTQLAAFDSPVAAFLDEEVRRFKNYPMTCQNLQSLATFLRFDWNTPHKYREAFKARLFDYVGKLDVGGATEWYTKRARF